jgi:hypothetical protein
MATNDEKASMSLLFLYNTIFSQAACSACCLLHTVSLFGLFFNPSDGDELFLKNDG